MKFLVFGSLNIDKVYSLSRLPEKGETLSCEKYEIHVGGKGLNQAVALAKSGADVYCAGYVGKDGDFLVDFLNKSSVNTELIKKTDTFTGHAVIEVDSDGQNQMILFPGANREINRDYCDKVLENFSAGDLVLMQYETSQVEYMIKKAHSKGMLVALNPSPFVEELKDFDYSNVDFLILNESEGQSITGKTDTDDVINELKKLCGGAIVLTLGADGAIYADKNEKTFIPAFKVNAVDTTGAGDTFTGYFLNSVLSSNTAEQSLKTASAASAVVVGKSGAAETIPDMEQVKAFFD
ncbi:MAG: ribokinase, partial [Ruminococcus sp.]|nr:ribokinase [Candidatus Copronaster equi]